MNPEGAVISKARSQYRREILALSSRSMDNTFVA
jgi:hypothetical protein